MNKDNMAIIMCPPLSDYPEAPNDQPGCELFDCPICHNKMWLSEKKRGLLLFSSCANKWIFLSCYHCIKEKAKSEPSFFENHTRVDIGA
jgi:hypothetical protein